MARNMTNVKESLAGLCITAFITLIGNFFATKISPIEALPGILILVAIAIIGITLAEILPIKIPAVAYVVTLSTILTIPGFPMAELLSAQTGKINFLALCTPILAYAGIYTGKNLEGLKKTGWRIFVLAIFVMLGTYLGSAIIAQVILKMLGQI
ncbi:DUF340 domain-containing protein [Fusobacterium gonidiaformans]|uniref:DUF340 domain-containing protein n=1 Tax=Fusobacterium gonidiaformans TaxID=849 RepID=UPI0001BC64FE|nr:DUF340 domain-containing protein [Fusobacterium gonidiaformans]AVQ17240.1 DUF340 domain-containing protein [Fusobacterium gonidiaformans ATCC 25563]EFS27998.2 hypothetical protein FGAG_00319 [Fusobacterium gonidiaformans ATCC 25563]